jgi:hypothetical protein
MTLLVVEVTLAFIVFCADSIADQAGDESLRPMRQRILRSILWPITLGTWFTHRNLRKLARFGAIVWLAVTSGWLLSLEQDRMPSPAVFLLVAEATMAFVIYCVDAMSSDLHNKRLRRALRAVLWIKPLADYLRDEDTIMLIQANVTVWVLLTTGWLLSLETDRIGRPLAWVGR